MVTPKDTDLRAINVGMLGWSGYHDRMLQGGLEHTPQMVLAYAVWTLVAKLPPNLEIYRISPDITVALLLKLALAIWTAKVSWHVVVALWFGLRWLNLEIHGVQWVRRNDHNFRVMFYRLKDGSLKYDKQTRTARLDHELNVAAWRRAAFATQSVKLLAYLFFYAALPYAYAYSFQFMSVEVHGFLDRWQLLSCAQWFWFYLKCVPVMVAFGSPVFEWFVYVCGAQYIPGAKLRDPVIAEKTLETLRAEQSLGAAAFVAPDLASIQLGSSS